MGLHETEAVVLRTYNLAEADKIVVCLTRSAGVIRAVARGARRLKSRFGAGLEPFTVISLTYYEKEGRELVSIRQAEIVSSFFDLANSSEAVAAMAYMSELIMEFAPPHEPNEKIFRMVKAVLEALRRERAALPALVRYFEVWILKLSGFLPDLGCCAECGRRFDGTSQGYFNAEFKLRCGACSQRLGTVLSTAAHGLLRSAQRLAPFDFARAGQDLTETQKSEMKSLTQNLIVRALERQPRGQISFR